MCAHPNPGRTRFAAEELLRRLFQFASVVLSCDWETQAQCFAQVCSSPLLKCPVRNPKTFHPLWQRGQRCHRDSQVTSCSIAQTGASVLCSGSKKRSWISYRNTFPLQGSLFTPKIILKNLFFGFSGAPQWRCLTQLVVASHSVSFCCPFHVCEVEWKRHRNSWLSFPGPAVCGAPQREAPKGDKGATSSAGT